MMTLAASAGLALAAIVGPVIAGQGTPAAAATAVGAARAGTAAPATGFAQEILSEYDAYYLNSCANGAPCRASIQFVANAFRLTCSTCKWTEIQTPDGNCLVIVGSVSAGFQVGEAFCNDRPAELWWFPSGASAGGTQIINDYGTSLLKHDACMWNPESNPVTWGTLVTVRDCQVSQPSRQIWDFYSII